MCGKPDPNEIPKERMRDEANYQSQINGVNSQQQRKIAAAMNIPQKAILVSFKQCLNKNNNTLFDLSRDTTDRSKFGDDAEKIFYFDALAESLKNNLRLEKQNEDQIEQISHLIMNPYRLSYELMGQKKYLICNIQHLMEILQDLFYNRNQAESLEYLKNHFHRLTVKYIDIMILIQQDNLIKLKIQHIKEPDRQYSSNQKPIQIVSKFSLKHQKLESIDMIVRSGSQQRIENPQQNEQVTQLNIVIIGLQKQVQSFKYIISSKVAQQNRMNEQISFLKNKIQNYETQIQNKDQQIRSAKKQMTNSLKSQNQELNNSIVEVTRQKQQLQIKVKGLVQTLSNLEEEIKVMKQSNSILSHQSQDLFQKERKINDQITTMLYSQKRQIQDQKNMFESEKNTLFEERTRIQNQIRKLQELQKQQKVNSHKMQARMIQLAKQRDQMKMNFSNLLNELKLSKLFTGDILQTQAKQKAFLVESIEKHMNKKIEKAKILYDTKKNYNVNYHERIDGKQNLVLILQTKNAIIAGYYSGKYAEGTYMTSEGLILSLNNQKYYRLNNFANNPKKNKNDTKPVYGMIYDKLFLIFGNAQIRVKPGEKDRKIFSNFGISNSYFNCQGDNVSHLLCDGKKNDVQFTDYQIYQVIFSSNQKQQAILLPNLTQQTTPLKLQNEKIQQVYQTTNYKTVAKNLEEESIRKDSHIQQLNKQLEQLKHTKEELRFQNQRLSFNIDATQKQLGCLQSQVFSLNQKLRNKEDQFSVMKQKIQGYERLSVDTDQHYNRISSQLDNIKLLNSEYSLDNSQLRSKIVSLQMQLNEVKQNQQIQKQQQPQNSQSIVSMQKSEEISIIGSLSQISLAESGIIKNKLESALTTCESYRIQKQNKTKQIQHLKVELSTQKVFIEQKCQEIQQLIRMKCALQEQRDSLLITSKEKGVENLDYKVIKSMQQQIKELKQTNELLQQRLSYQLQKQSKMRTQSFVQLISHFNGELLQKRKDQKRFLIESIQAHMKKLIEKTRILYESIKDNKINFHDRLNGKNNLVIVLQTQKALIAGYYSGIYANKTTMNEEGLILSLTNRKFYRLNNFTNYPKKNKNDKKVMLGMIYDDFYLIFGNAEIRVKPGQNNPKVFSNFAVSNSYFNNEGDNVNMLLCEGRKNDVPIIRYEIYELIFFNMPFEQPTQ